jgi:nucleoside 2-deoxyribosyltransferase
MKIYLAGGLRSGWQDTLKGLYPQFEFISPLDKDDKSMNVYEYGNWDLHYIKQCDLVFAYMEKTNPSGIGLSCELGFAYGIGKTVITCLEPDNEFIKDGYLQFIKKVSHIVYDNFDIAIKYLGKFK